MTDRNKQNPYFSKEAHVKTVKTAKTKPLILGEED